MVIIVAASFNIPGGRLSRPVDLFLLRFLSSLKTSSSETELKTKCSGDVVSHEFTGLPQTKLQSGKLLVFKTPAIVEKKSQKPWAIEDEARGRHCLFLAKDKNKRDLKNL